MIDFYYNKAFLKSAVTLHAVSITVIISILPLLLPSSYPKHLKRLTFYSRVPIAFIRLVNYISSPF